MKRMLGLLVVFVLLMASLGMACNQAESEESRTKQGVDWVWLYEKDPVTWDIVEDGAWGKLILARGKDDMVIFSGHNLDSNVEYTLIRYTEPTGIWIETHEALCLDSGVSGDDGNINLHGDFLDGGAKVWLVLSSDVDCETSKMTAWNPTEYLFENNLIV